MKASGSFSFLEGPLPTTSPRSAKKITPHPQAAFRLPEHVRPLHYQVHIAPALEAGTFSGSVNVELAFAKPTDRIFLHAVDITVGAATIRVGREQYPAEIHTHAKDEAIEVRLPQRFPAGKARLVLDFEGRLQTSLRGFYGAVSDGRHYGFTQLEAADARRFFPCFDEPSFKARFTFIVTTEAKNAVISNGPIEREEQLADGRKRVHFATTPKLSTYLCALCVGELEASEERRVGRTPIRVWHVPGKGHLTTFALEAAVAALTRLEDYFSLDYPYEKLDLIAVPDFEAGAMENAGAVTFRETLLLIDPVHATLGEKKRVAEVIAHELAHMWYGDLVTMAWWNDLWLNEAFATWMAFRVVDAWRPEWRMWNNFEHHRAAAFNLDALANTHPIYAEVHSPAQATENFDAITYEKGASVVRMVENYLGANVFRSGVRKYIRRHREGNAEAADLWKALEEASGQKIHGVVRAWIEQPGFPLLKAERSDNDGIAVLALRQQRFFANPKHSDTKQRWPLPLVIKVGTKRGSTRLVRQLVTKGREKIELGNASTISWVYANAAEGGFHRPLHDERNLEVLSGSLSTSLTAAERMGLAGHQWAAVRGGHARIESFLELVGKLGDETDFDVLDALGGPLRYIEDYIAPEAGEKGVEAFRAWVASTFSPALRSLGWGGDGGESEDTRVRRASLLRLVGEIGDDPAVVAEAMSRVDAYFADRNTLEPNLADSVISIAARHGDASFYDRLLKIVPESQTPQEKRRFQMALADFQPASLVDRTLALTLKDDISTQDVGIAYIRLFANRDLAARERTWAFVKKKWDAVSRRLPPMMVSRVVDATPTLRTKIHKKDVAAFFKTHPVPTAHRALKQAMERFDLNADFAKRAAKGLRAWLAERD